MLLVVAVHVGNPYGFEPRYLGGQSLLGWINIPGQAGVDLFFVISGLIMTITTWNLDRGVKDSRRFMLRRVRRIYPIYWIVSLVVLAVYLAKPTFVNSQSDHPPQILESFVLLPQAGLPLLAIGWTLTYEMYFYLMFAAALLVGRRWLPWILGGWALITLALALAFSDSDVPAMQLLTNPLLLEFVYGVVVGYVVMTRPPVAPGWLLGAGIVLITVAVTYASGFDEALLDSWFRVVAVGPPAALIVLGAIGLERQRRLIAPAGLQYIGDASYSIYLWHTLLLVAAGRLMVLVLPPPNPLHVVLLIAIPIAVVVACLVLFELVERPLLSALGQHMAARPTVARGAGRSGLGGLLLGRNEQPRQDEQPDEVEQRIDELQKDVDIERERDRTR